MELVECFGGSGQNWLKFQLGQVELMIISGESERDWSNFQVGFVSESHQTFHWSLWNWSNIPLAHIGWEKPSL